MSLSSLGTIVASKKSKPLGRAHPLEPSRPRIDRAVREGRFQQALELAKELYKHEPTPPHRELLHTVYLGRAGQLQQMGYTRDAVTTLHAALLPPGLLPSWKFQIAELLAGCGDVKAALDLCAGADASQVERVLPRAGDAALDDPSHGRALLPESMHADFDRVLRAFQQIEAGQDDAARETLQGIGLRSPFVEWKLMLRGLQAYHARDDARALDNWQRLTADRLAARLVAPLRARIDPTFRAAQSHETQAALQRQANRLQGGSALALLRDLQADLARMGPMGPTFRKAEAAAAALKQEAPRLVPRLASCLYWAVLNQGQPEDVPRYLRAFGPPADDPLLNRLLALGWEKHGDWTRAHQHWQKYENDVARNPTVWPGDQATRARALVWQHMGRNAASVPSDAMLKNVPAFLFDRTARPKPLKPSAEECFRRSLQLAPDAKETHEDLFYHHLTNKDEKKALEAGLALLDKFPNDTDALTELGRIKMRRQAYADALDFFQRALRTNPLDPELRNQVCNAHLFRARTFAESERFDEAREHFRAALALSGRDDSTILCKWAACEYRSGDDEKAEELLGRALAGAGSELAVNYGMLIEVIRLGLKGPLKTRFGKAFEDGLKEPPTGATAAHLARTTAAHEAANVSYTGQKTHRKKVIDYLKKSQTATFTEQELREVCDALTVLDSYRVAKKYMRMGQKKFPGSPHFWLAEVRMEMGRGPGVAPMYDLRRMLEKARPMVESLPPGRERDRLLEEIETREQAIEAMNPFASLFSGGGFDPLDFIDDELD